MITVLATTVRKGTRAKRGFTLTEIAIVLGIMGTILGAIWVAASRTSQSNKTNKLVTEILSIQSSIRSAYVSRANMSAGCFSTTFVNMGIIPPDMVVSGAGGVCGGTPSIRDPWG